ncbi:MAG: hypothetical protein WA990_11310 [Rubrobacteraceae bacterium]
MMGGFDGVMGGWSAFGWLWMLIPLLFWGGLLALIVWAIVRVFPGQRDSANFSGTPAKPAEEVLRERFARGEIDAGEYERSLEVLKSEKNYLKGGV